MQKEENKNKFEEIVKKYNLDLEKLKKEQEKLAKNLSIKDAIDFNLAERTAGIYNVFFKNRIVSAVVVLSDGEVVEQEYFEDKINFPYIPGFRAYRELSAMISAFNKLNEKPDVVFINGNGILHERGLGLASHFSLAAGVPAIGITDSIIENAEIRSENILLKGEIVGKILKTKEGANPIYVSPGNMISAETAEKLARKLTFQPYKLPEPLRLAKRYAKEVIKEIFKQA